MVTFIISYEPHVGVHLCTRVLGTMIPQVLFPASGMWGGGGGGGVQLTCKGGRLMFTQLRVFPKGSFLGNHL